MIVENYESPVENKIKDIFFEFEKNKILNKT